MQKKYISSVCVAVLIILFLFVVLLFFHIFIQICYLDHLAIGQAMANWADENEEVKIVNKNSFQYRDQHNQVNNE